MVSLVALLVSDYDEAIAWFCDKLHFVVVEDRPLTPQKRWVVVSPGDGGTRILLAKAVGESQEARVGDQTGGRVFLFLEVLDFQRERSRMEDAGVRFLEATRNESYGSVAVFQDLYGNRWDLLGPRPLA